MIGFKTITTSQVYEDINVGGRSGWLLDCTNGDVEITLPVSGNMPKNGTEIVFIKTDSTINEARFVTSDGSLFNGGISPGFFVASPYSAAVLTIINGVWFYVWVGDWAGL